ncbi:MAG: thioredoxin domain-containing protein, partial [Methanobacteriaceae archaeon]
MVLSPKKEKSDYYNHLKNEKSPYLQQHLHNPVDWYPWDNEAFLKAKTEDKPIFLSIGYSTCHWCHVMARESFQDQEIARLLNEVFVSVKVDREERPDIDSVYMAVCQMMTGSGGWPLTILLTPDLNPFFAGTYFPKEGHGRGVGLKDLILNVKDLWQERRSEVINSAKDMVTALEKTSKTKPGDDLGDEILHKAYDELGKNFDQEYAGFGGFQKFPTPHHIFFLLRYWKRTGTKYALEMVEKTLIALQQGGIYDQIGYGFHRYSVDPQWLVPHFEKMLYDQALLAIAYTEVYQATGKNIYRETAEQTLEYLLRDMQSPEGGFYSAEDADSEGVEGKFYLWKREEILKVLGDEEGELFCQVYQVKEKGNFAEEATGRNTGQNILHLKGSLEESAGELGIETRELKRKLERSRDKLFQWREKRLRPQRDDKVLADWNGLVIAALSYAGLVYQQANYVGKATEAADFVLSHMCHHKRLWHRWRDGEPAVDGNLDDYAYLIWGLLELYQSTFKAEYLESALKLNQTLMDHVWDVKDGGFFFTA